MPFPWINPQQHLATPTGGTPTATEPSTNGKDREDGEDGSDNESTIDSDVVDCTLNPEESKEFQEFDPRINDNEVWKPPVSMSKFLEKHFNKCLDEQERQAILADFPKPQCDALQAPKLDSKVEEQLSRKGKDSHFGAEKTLYMLQEQLLEVTGPLTCLWSDLLRPDGNPTKEQMVQLLQRVLVQVGSTSQAINIERRKIAWGRINPGMKSLAKEDYDNRKGNLFGPGFLEKASKKVEADKALAKVVQDGSNTWKRSFEDDPKDLRRFLSKGAPAQYGSKGKQRQFKPYNPNTKKYYQQKKPKQVHHQQK